MVREWVSGGPMVEVLVGIRGREVVLLLSEHTIPVKLGQIVSSIEMLFG
jgi:hypothetical protein